MRKYTPLMLFIVSVCLGLFAYLRTDVSAHSPEASLKAAYDKGYQAGRRAGSSGGSGGGSSGSFERMFPTIRGGSGSGGSTTGEIVPWVLDWSTKPESAEGPFSAYKEQGWHLWEAKELTDGEVVVSSSIDDKLSEIIKKTGQAKNTKLQLHLQGASPELVEKIDALRAESPDSYDRFWVAPAP